MILNKHYNREQYWELKSRDEGHTYLDIFKNLNHNKTHFIHILQSWMYIVQFSGTFSCQCINIRGSYLRLILDSVGMALHPPSSITQLLWVPHMRNNYLTINPRNMCCKTLYADTDWNRSKYWNRRYLASGQLQNGWDSAWNFISNGHYLSYPCTK